MISKLNDLNNIFISLFSIDLTSLERDDFDAPLLGKKFKLQARDLVYLFIEIQNKFQIKIDYSYIKDDKFKTINNIIEIVEG